MTDLTANTGKMNEASEQMKKETNEFISDRQELDRLMNELSNGWDDASFKELYNNKYVGEIRTSLDKLSTILEEFYKNISDKASIYDEAVNEISKNVRNI